MLLLSNVGPDLSAFVCFFNFSRKEKKRKGKNKVFQLYFYDFRVPKRIRRRRRCKSCKFSLIIQITRRLTHTLYKGFISCYNFKRRGEEEEEEEERPLKLLWSARETCRFSHPPALPIRESDETRCQSTSDNSRRVCIF